MNITVPCPRCSGTCYDTFEDRHAETNHDVCQECGGEGVVPAQKGETQAASAVPNGEPAVPPAGRDFDARPYSLDEQRVAHFLFDLGAAGGDDPIGFILVSHAELARQRNEAVAEVARLADPELKDIRMANGDIEMAVAGPIVDRLALALTAQFRESGATNYLEMNLNARDAPFERYCVTVQKVGAQSPHQLRAAAEAELAQVRASLPESLQGGALPDAVKSLAMGERAMREGFYRLGGVLKPIAAYAAVVLRGTREGEGEVGEVYQDGLRHSLRYSDLQAVLSAVPADTV